MSKAVISGYIGFGNNGDEGVFAALTADLRSVLHDVSITALSARPSETVRLYGVHAAPRFNPWLVGRTIAAADLFISGGGSLLQDTTSSRSLYYYLSLIWLAKLLGKKVMLYANGIGPIRRPINRRLTTAILNRVDLITVREELSLRELKALKVDRPPIEVTADPVFDLEPASEARAKDLLARAGLADRSGPLIGFAVRHWAGIDSWSTAVAKAADHCHDRYGARVVFIPPEYPDDISASERVAAHMSRPPLTIRDRCLATETMALIGQLDLLVGMRLHALIFAARQGIPLVGIEYDPKVTAFLARTEQRSAGTIADLKAETLIAQVDRVMAERRAVSEALSAKVAPFVRLAKRNAELAAALLTGR